MPAQSGSFAIVEYCSARCAGDGAALSVGGGVCAEQADGQYPAASRKSPEIENAPKIFFIRVTPERGSNLLVRRAYQKLAPQVSLNKQQTTLAV